MPFELSQLFVAYPIVSMSDEAKVKSDSVERKASVERNTYNEMLRLIRDARIYHLAAI